MAGQKFEYDESGSTFFYFLISFLGLVLVPCTFYFWPNEDTGTPKTDEKKSEDSCQCEGCLKKEIRMKKPEKWKGKKKNFQRFLLIIGWIFMLFLIYRVQEFDYEYANFDPYDILGVGMQASQADIKKAYRKLSLLYHPDKPTGDERKFMKLNKAYQALTDDTARRNYELYGNPDGPGAMHFGIALPSWIVEKENSLWVLGLYALVFMIGLPTVVGIWWYRSSKFSNDQILLHTMEIYYHFFNKTPEMIFKRALMVLSTSLEFAKMENPEIVERPSDDIEVPKLIKALPDCGEKTKEPPMCYSYSIKARAILYAHLARMLLNEDTLDRDRLYYINMCPTLVNEMVTCVSQLIMLAHAGRVVNLPSLTTVEAVMKLSPCVVQAIQETKSPLLQLPHVSEDMIRYFVHKKRPIKTLSQFASLSTDERRQIVRNLSDAQIEDVTRVLKAFPHIKMDVNYEVVDDDDTGVFTAGAIVTVTVSLVRTPYEEMFMTEEEGDAPSLHLQHDDDTREKDAPSNMVIDKESGWRRPAAKKGKVRQKKVVVVKGKKEEKQKEAETPKQKKGTDKEKKVDAKKAKVDRVEDVDLDSDDSDSDSHSDESQAKEADTESHHEEKTEADEDAEWEKFQKGLLKREKVLEGKSKMSHSAHSPHFTVDKQEYWWTYVCDRKKHMLITAPYQITNLEDSEEVQLRFTAPAKPGVYTFQVCLRSDAYLGFDCNEDIKMDVKEAREIPTAHPQWEEFSDEEEDGEGGAGGEEDEESEYTTDDNATDDDSD